MARYIGEKRITPYYGDGRPVNSYQNGKKLAGWREAFQTGSDVSFDDTYNDIVDVLASGRSMQPQDYYREVASSNIIPITAHKENSLRSARIDTLAQQTSRYYRELSGSGILSVSDNDELSARRARIDTLAQQTPMYYRESNSAGVISFSDNNELYARKAIVSTTAKQTVTVQGKNLLDKAKLYAGWRSYVTSEFQTNTGRCLSPLIKINPSLSYVLSGRSVGSQYQIWYFDASGLFLSNTQAIESTGFVSSASAAYMCVGFPDTIANMQALSLQLEAGSTATPYVPFVPNSPSIDYSAPIAPAVAAGESVSIRGRAKNLFNKALLTTDLNSKSLTQLSNGFSFMSSVGENNTKRVSCDVLLKVGTYHIKGTCSQSDGLSGGIGVYDVLTSSFVINASGGGSFDITFTITTAKIYSFRFYLSYNSGVDVTITYTDVQLETGSSATSYEAYSGTYYTGAFTNAAYGLTGAPDTRDLVSGREVHNTALITLDGVTYKASNVVATYSDGNIRLTVLGYASAKQETSIISSHLTPGIVSGGIYLGQNQAFSIIIAGATLGVTSDASNADKVTACNNWLASKVTAGDPIKVLYVLATPTILSNTPQTIALNTTLNNCFSDTGTLMVAYQVKPGSNLAGDILSPHPDYPAPITPAIPLGGSGKVYRRGKNYVPPFPTTITVDNYGIGLSVVSGQQYIIANGAFTGASSYGRVLLSEYQPGIFVKAGSTYTFKPNLVEGSNTGVVSAFLTKKSENSVYWSAALGYSVTFTPTTDMLLIVGLQCYPNSTCTNAKFTFQLEFGSSATTYEPYTGTDYTATPQVAMYGLSSAPDSYSLVDGKEVHPTKKYAFTGTESIEAFTSGDATGISCFRVQIPGSYDTVGSVCRLACSYFKWKAYSYISTYAEIGTVGQSATFFFFSTSTQSLDSFKVQLAAKYAAGAPVEIVYQLATPIIYSNTPQTVALSTTGVNNLFSDVGSLFFAYQVKVGSNIAGDIASPTPDYPAPIYPAIALGGSGKIRRCKKNYFDGLVYGRMADYGVVDGRNVYRLSHLTGLWWNFVGKPNIQYTFSFVYRYDNASSLGVTYIGFHYSDGSKEYVVLNSTTWASKTITSAVGKTAIGIGQSFNNEGYTYFDKDTMQLEVGTVATPYEPYSGSDTTLTPQAAMYGLTGAVDSIEASGVEVHPTAFSLFKGATGEAWTYVSAYDQTNTVAFYINMVVKAAKPIRTSRFNFVNAAYSGTGDIECAFVDYATYIIVRIAKARMSGWSDTLTAAEKQTLFKTWLSTNNFEALYQLSTPTTYSNTPLTVSLSDGLNNVFSDVGTLNVAYQVSDGQNVAGDISSPTPTYPAIIIPASGLIQVEGRNLFGLTLESGAINSTTGNNSSSNISLRSVGYISIEKDTNYVVSTNIPNITYRRALWYANDGSYLGFTNTGAINISSVSYPTATKIRICIVTSQDVSVLPSYWIQLERGSTAHPYLRYRPILTQQSSDLRAIPNGAGGWIARDTETIEWVGGERHRVVTRRVGHRELSGSGNWGNQTTMYQPGSITASLQFTDMVLLPGKNVVCSHFGSANNYFIINTVYGHYQNYLYFCIPTNIYATYAEFLARVASLYAAGNPIVVDYPLATPAEPQDLGPVDLPSYLYHTRIRTSGTYIPDMQVGCKVTDLTV